MNRAMRRVQKRAERGAWQVFADTVAEVIGFGTPLYRAAKACDSETFYRLLGDLPPADLVRLTARLQALDRNRRDVALRYVNAGKVR